MKSYREVADSVFARREQYIAAQRKKKQVIARTTVSVGSVALVSLAGFALHKNGGLREKLPVADGTPTTTTTATPTKTQDTTTATTTVPTQTQDTTTATTTATGESTTPSKTNPTKTTATTSDKTPSTSPSTAPSKTEPSQTTAPSKTTHSTQTTQTTHTTSTTKPTSATQPTVPPQTEDYIIVETPAGSEPSNPYMISAKIPARCSAADEYVPISLSYGVVTAGTVKDPPPNSYMALYLQDDEENVAILKRIDRQLFLTEYSIEILWDDDRMWPIDYIYTHTETILFPLSLCSKDSGRIWIALDKETEEGESGTEVKKCMTSICFDYVCSETSITFHIVN